MKENNSKQEIKVKENKKPDIKIFVSHRIDMEAETIDNPLYVNVRCGAVYDKRENIDMLGDNTGDNISEKRERYGEYTVQYWAWKNVKADYYGLCHYRRYLSFIDEYIDCKEPHMFAVESYMNKAVLKKYALLNANKMKKEIKQYDIISSYKFPVNALPFVPRANNVMEVWKYHPEYLIGEYEINLLLETIKEKFPEYYNTALEYLEQPLHKGFNCFIMKKDLFFKMCEFEFNVLFEVEKKLDFTKYEGKSVRTMGYLGEILYSTFLLWLENQNQYRMKETQIVLFRNTHKKIHTQIRYKEKIKKILSKILPSYRVALRLEEHIIKMQAITNSLKNDINAIQKREKIKFWIGEPKFEKNLDIIKKNFWLSFPKAEGDLRLIQKGNLLLIKRFKQICDKLNVQFWMHGGSLIGAVRHNGFIPWDDDIDIAMMRSDFMKVKNFLKDNYNYEIAEYYYTCFGCRSYRFRRKDLLSNFFMDIFVYDNYHNNNDNILEEWKMIRSFKSGIQSQWKNILNEFNIKISNNIRLDDNIRLKTAIDKLIDRYVERFSSNQKEDYLLWGLDNNYENSTKYAWHHGRIFKYDDIFPLKECEYEGNIYNIPSNFEKYILKEYGIGYLEMPNNIGIPMHLKQYFKNVNIEEVYDELLKSENNIKEI